MFFDMTKEKDFFFETHAAQSVVRAPKVLR